jgi:hypothetical protein
MTRILRPMRSWSCPKAPSRAQVVSIGPMLQGLAEPVNDLSRGALVDDIIYTVAMTAIQARGGNRRNETDRPAELGPGTKRKPPSIRPQPLACPSSPTRTDTGPAARER